MIVRVTSAIYHIHYVSLCQLYHIHVLLVIVSVSGSQSGITYMCAPDDSGSLAGCGDGWRTASDTGV